MPFTCAGLRCSVTCDPYTVPRVSCMKTASFHSPNLKPTRSNVPTCTEDQHPGHSDVGFRHQHNFQAKEGLSLEMYLPKSQRQVEPNGGSVGGISNEGQHLRTAQSRAFFNQLHQQALAQALAYGQGARVNTEDLSPLGSYRDAPCPDVWGPGRWSPPQ